MRTSPSAFALVGVIALASRAPLAVAAPPPDPITMNVFPNGSFTAWIIDGVSNPTLTLFRGQKYIFHVTATGHPFYIKTQRETGDVSQWTDGVKNNGDQNGDVTFDVPETAPSFLFYQCGVHPSMGGSLLISNPVGVGDPSPTVAWLGRAVPNPTPEGASFRVGLPRDAKIDVVLFDARGRKVRTLWNGTMTAGEHSVVWDGLDASRRPVTSGPYFYRLRVEGRSLTGRLVVAR